MVRQTRVARARANCLLARPAATFHRRGFRPLSVVVCVPSDRVPLLSLHLLPVRGQHEAPLPLQTARRRPLRRAAGQCAALAKPTVGLLRLPGQHCGR